MSMSIVSNIICFFMLKINFWLDFVDFFMSVQALTFLKLFIVTIPYLGIEQGKKINYISVLKTMSF